MKMNIFGLNCLIILLTKRKKLKIIDTCNGKKAQLKKNLSKTKNRFRVFLFTKIFETQL